jgi:hypothetical protein
VSGILTISTIALRNPQSRPSETTVTSQSTLLGTRRRELNCGCQAVACPLKTVFFTVNPAVVSKAVSIAKKGSTRIRFIEIHRVYPPPHRPSTPGPSLPLSRRPSQRLLPLISCRPRAFPSPNSFALTYISTYLHPAPCCADNETSKNRIVTIRLCIVPIWTYSKYFLLLRDSTKATRLLQPLLLYMSGGNKLIPAHYLHW